MNDFSNDSAMSMIRLSEKGVDILAKLLQKLFQLIKYISETNERKLSRELKKNEIDKIRQSKDIEDARKYLNQTRGLVKAKYMQNAGKDLYPISQPMSPAELRRFNELAKSYGLNYYTMQNEAVIDKYNSVKSNLNRLNKEERVAREKGLAEHGDHLDQLRQDYADLQKKQENKTFISPADQNRLKKIEKEISDIENKINQEALPLERREMKEKLEKQLEALEKQRNDVIVVVFKEDLSIVENITERMNMEIDLSDIDRESDAIKQKQVLSENDTKRLADLDKKKDDIIRGEFNKFNQENSEEIVNAALNKDRISYNHQVYNFEDALNRTCNRDYAKEPCIICERNNPDNYIEAQSEKMMNKGGLPYNNTTFTIYKEGQQIGQSYQRKATLDGKQTSSRGENYWSKIKSEMKEQSGFGDDLVVFAAKEDYLKYRTEYNQAKVDSAEEIRKDAEKQLSAAERRMNREDSIGVEGKAQSFKDYNGMINRLNAQLADHRMALNEQGAVCHSDSMKEINITDLNNDDEKARCAEAINIGKQIGVLKQLNDAQTQLAFLDLQQKQNYDTYNRSDKSDQMKAMYESMRDNLHHQSYEIVMNTAVLSSQYARLEDELNDLRSVKIVETIKENNEKIVDEHEKEADNHINSASFNEIPHGEEREEHSLNKEQWNQAIDQGNFKISSMEPEITVEHEK